MKFLRDYFGSELETLTDEDVQKLADFECADAGVAFLPEHPGTFEPSKLEKTCELWEVCGMHFESQDDAHKVRDCAAKLKRFELAYNYAIGYDHKYKKQVVDPPDVVKVQAFSAKDIDTLKDRILAEKARKELFDGELKNFQEVQEKRAEHSSRVSNIVREAKAFGTTRESMLQSLDRFIRLAEGSAEIGFRFFDRAHPNYREHAFVYLKNKELVVVRRYFVNPENEKDVPVVDCRQDEVLELLLKDVKHSEVL